MVIPSPGTDLLPVLLPPPRTRDGSSPAGAPAPPAPVQLPAEVRAPRPPRGDRRRSRGARERLWHLGAAALSDAELVAVLLGTGSPRGAVGALAVELLESSGGLRGLAAAHPAEIARFSGVGEAKAARLLAAVEIGRRVCGTPWQRGETFRGAQQVFDHFAPRLRDERRELFIAAYLDVRRRLIGEELISCGSLVASIVHPREVFRPAVRLAAASVIAVHNHPSGDPTPSAEDWAVTERLRRSGETLGIELLDHVVIGDGAWTSLRDECHRPTARG